MSYRCDICNAKVPAGQPRRVHNVMRRVLDGQVERQEIERELPVCSLCSSDLEDGMPLAELLRHHRPSPPLRTEPLTPPVSLPLPKPVVAATLLGRPVKDTGRLLDSIRAKQPAFVPTPKPRRSPEGKGGK